MYIVYCILYIVYCILYIVYCILYIVYSVFLTVVQRQLSIGQYYQIAALQLQAILNPRQLQSADRFELDRAFHLIVLAQQDDLVQEGVAYHEALCGRGTAAAACDGSAANGVGKAQVLSDYGGFAAGAINLIDNTYDLVLYIKWRSR